MSSLGSRERNLAIIFGIFLVCVVLYVFPIRMLSNSTADLEVKREELQAQKDYYDALASQNEATRAEIEEIEHDISELEQTFLPEINSECIKQWVLSVFERNECFYLVSAETSDIMAPDISLPDGSISDDGVIIKSIDVQYSTTDGWNIGAYNGTNSVQGEDGLTDPALVDAAMADIAYTGMNSRTGYDEFINALKEIEGTNEDCIKVTKIAVEEKSGYLLMSATINFYSATFNDRVSEPDTTAPYVSWNGMTGVATDHGFIGFPFFVDDTGSEWYGCIMPDEEAADRERPFAAYYSAQTWANLVDGVGTANALGLTEGSPFLPSGGSTQNDDGGDEVPDDETTPAET